MVENYRDRTLNQALQQISSLNQIPHLLVPIRNFAFHGDRAAVSDLLEFGNEAVHAHVAAAKGVFRTQLSFPRWPLAVFRMNADDVVGNNSKGLDGFSASVQDHICRVEVDAYVVAIQRFEKVAQRRSRLLACFQAEVLPVPAARVGQSSDTFNHGMVVRMIRVFRDESDVRGHLVNAERACEV